MRQLSIELHVQKSRAIAKMTPRCAKKLSGVPDYAHGYFSRDL